MNTLLFVSMLLLAATIAYWWGRSVRERGHRQTEQIRHGRNLTGPTVAQLEVD